MLQTKIYLQTLLEFIQSSAITNSLQIHRFCSHRKLLNTIFFYVGAKRLEIIRFYCRLSAKLQRSHFCPQTFQSHRHLPNLTCLNHVKLHTPKHYLSNMERKAFIYYSTLFFRTYFWFQFQLPNVCL